LAKIITSTFISVDRVMQARVGRRKIEGQRKLRWQPTPPTWRQAGDEVRNARGPVSADGAMARNDP
jgi:hypothetical protein